MNMIEHYNKLAEKSVIVTPEDIVLEMIDLLPTKLWNSPKLKDMKFMDISCKSGVFLKKLLIRLMMAPALISDFPDEEIRKRHILDNMLFGIAVCKLSLDISRFNLYNKVYIKGNIRQINDTYEEYIQVFKNKDMKFITSLIKETFGSMKIDVIIGNPPYQDISGKSSIYPKFINMSVETADIVSMITRDNWMNGKAFKTMREALMDKGSISDIVHYPKVGEVFEGVSVSVAHFTWVKGQEQKTQYTCIKDGEIVVNQELDLKDGIIYKSEMGKSIISKTGNKSDWAKYYSTRSYPFMDQRKRLSMDSTAKPDEEHNVGVIVNGEYPVYVSINNFMNRDEVSKYKVVCGVIINEASVESPGNVLTNIKALGRNVVASETWSLIASFNTEEEALNCKKYVMTRFVRFIANQSVNGRSNVTDNTFECVPIQNFTSNSDIDWSQSIAEIDKQLYEKYNLSAEEINYIESTVKAMQ